MGLVLAWLFTGVNPLKASEDKLADIDLGAIPLIKEPSGYIIRNTIVSMLEYDYHKRVSPSEALKTFLHVYELNIDYDKEIA